MFQRIMLLLYNITLIVFLFALIGSFILPSAIAYQPRKWNTICIRFIDNKFMLVAPNPTANFRNKLEKLTMK